MTERCCSLKTTLTVLQISSEIATAVTIGLPLQLRMKGSISR